MSLPNDRSNWLNKIPTNAEGGGSYVQSHYQTMVAMNSTGITALYNLTMAPTWKQMTSMLFTNPTEWLSSLTFYPFNVPIVPPGRLYYLNIGSIHVNHGTDFSCRATCKNISDDTANYLKDMGHCYIRPHFNNFMDYNPYTNIQVYLPYYGFVDIPANEVMGKWMYVWLYIDYFTGGGLYYVCVTDKESTALQGYDYSHMRIVSKVSCQMGYHLTIGGSSANENYRNLLMGTLSTALHTGLGTLAAMTGEQRDSKTTIQWQKTRYGKLEPYARSKALVKDTSSKQTSSGSNVMSSAATGLMSVENLYVTPSMEKVNNSVLDMAGPKCVKVVIKRPRPVPVDAWYGSLYGYPSGTTAVLGDLTGYTKVANIHLDGFSTATTDELSEIEGLLTSGVIM